MFKSQVKRHGGGANEEWPEITEVKIGERRPSTVTTNQAPSENQVSLKNLSAGDLKSIKNKTPSVYYSIRGVRSAICLTSTTAGDLKAIKKQDPFLYYSIPGCRSAKILGKEVDVSNLGENKIPRCSNSCPSKLHSVQVCEKNVQTVTRSRRVSFEVHPDVLLFEDLGILDDVSEDEESVGSTDSSVVGSDM